MTATAVYLILTGALVAAGLQRTGGTFVYAQDDPYIHLALARTLAEHGVWGIRPDEFASASSSPLWTLLLAASWKLGLRMVWWPSVVNVLCGVALVALLDRLLAASVAPRARLLALVAIVVSAPLPTLVLIGLEHTLQSLLVVAFVWTISSSIVNRQSSIIGPMVLASLLVATRYEGLFVVAAAGVVLLWCRRTAAAVAIGAAAVVPVAAAGFYFVAHGAAFLPNSVLMKSLPARFATVASGVSAVLGDWIAVVNLFTRPPELALTIAVLLALTLAWRPPDRRWTRPVAIGVMFVITALVHAALVKLQWFFRYEAYLIVLGIVAIALLATDEAVRDRGLPFVRRNAAGAVLLGLLALPLAMRSLTALAATPPAIGNVFDQQYQMALFFREFYPRDAIALNDIGAVSWLSTSPLVDVYGLATQDVADAKRHGAWNEGVLASIVAGRGVRAVAMYEKVFAPIIPRSWTLVAEWRIRHNVGVSEDTVGFFAPTAADVERLRSALEEYAPRLPAAVEYRRP